MKELVYCVVFLSLLSLHCDSIRFKKILSLVCGFFFYMLALPGIGTMRSYAGFVVFVVLVVPLPRSKNKTEDFED
jgi:hypothetical protein